MARGHIYVLIFLDQKPGCTSPGTPRLTWNQSRSIVQGPTNVASKFRPNRTEPATNQSTYHVFGGPIPNLTSDSDSTGLFHVESHPQSVSSSSPNYFLAGPKICLSCHRDNMHHCAWSALITRTAARPPGRPAARPPAGSTCKRL